MPFYNPPIGPAIAPPDVPNFKIPPGTAPKFARDSAGDLLVSEESAFAPSHNPNLPPQISDKDRLTFTNFAATFLIAFLVIMAVLYVFRKIRQRKRAIRARQQYSDDVETGEADDAQAVNEEKMVGY